MSYSEANEWLKALPAGPACHATQNALERFCVGLTAGGSRHDAALERSWALIRVREMGHHGVYDALKEARKKFLDALKADRPQGLNLSDAA